MPNPPLRKLILPAVLLSKRCEPPSSRTIPAIFAIDVAPIPTVRAFDVSSVSKLPAGTSRSVPVAPFSVSVVLFVADLSVACAPLVRRNAASVSFGMPVMIGAGVTLPSMIRISLEFGVVRAGVQFAATAQLASAVPVQVYVPLVHVGTNTQLTPLLREFVPLKTMIAADPA